MSTNNSSNNISDSAFPEFQAGKLPGFLFVDHIAIAVLNGELEAQLKMYLQMGFSELHREEMLGTDQVREVLLQIGESPNLIQLLEPLSAESPVQKQIDRNGGRGGLAHVGFRVKNAQAAFDFLKAQGFRIIDKAPRPGSRGTTVFFMHPKSHQDAPFGVLYEIVEDSNIV
ncbi:MAG: VOC family protein [SAR324 cluster bacterium]|nr:VOC family protein [SAR324 cluster bacterium]